ncbi:MAG: inositol monophosphatase [Planctomycetota bacterium]
MSGPKAFSRSSGRSPPRAIAHDAPRNLADFAAQCALDVGRWLVRERPRRRSLGARDKGKGDPVTDLDVAAEERLRRAIGKRWPGHGFLGEETGASDLERTFVWIVDPIDGTANFANGLLPWGVSVACLRDGVPVAGAVYAAAEDRLCVAARGAGAHVLGPRRRRIRTPPAQRLDARAVIGVQWFRGVRHLPFLPALLGTGTRVRVFGCTVSQLCDVAVGRLHANVQQQGKVWDVAAAGLVVEEAGGLFTRWDGRPVFPCTPRGLTGHHATVGAPPGVHRQVLRLLDRVAVSRA